MSSVYLAEETALGRRVVIKILPPALAQAVSSERFRQEIRFAARLTHPHIVPLLTAGESDGLPWFTMPYIEGESLRARLARGPLPITEAVSLLRDVAGALVYAHGHGVVHRDIKPDNVLLSGGTAMVSDFGVAKALTAATGSEHTGLTTLGVVLGTPAYMAPEQGAGDPATDHRADIYAFGCVAYETLTGAPPFAGGSPAALIAAHIAEQPEPVARRRPDVPPALAELVMRCLAKKPADRPQTAAQLLEALNAIPASSVRLRRRLGSAAAMAMLAIVAGLALVLWPRLRSRLSAAGAADTAAIHNVAVLPFVNTSGNPDDEYFSDGMTDELAHAIAGLPDIRVAGRTSSYAYKGKAATVQEIGRTLGVAGVIAGTVRRAGDRLRVTVQLSSAADGFERWSHQYERRSSDVFGVQDELTRAIVAELEPTLRGTAASVASQQRGTDDTQAYEHFLRGRYFFERRGEPGLRRAIDEFRAAIARDSGFARAWAGIALVYVILPAYAPLDPDSLTNLCLAAARRALALDSTVVDARIALANAYSSQLRLAEADAEFRRTLALAPNDPTAYLWHSSVLQSQGRIEEALAADQKAAALDPLSAVNATDLATVLMYAKRYPEAIASARRGLELDSTFSWAHAILAEVYGVTGHPDSALAQLGLDPPRDAAGTWPGPGWRGMAAWAYGLAGRRADVDRMRAEIARHPDTQRGYDIAMAALASGRLEDAVAGLARSLERHELVYMEPSPSCSPVLEPLRRLASYRRLMERYRMRICEPG
jgi:eukaryotic-like serine/threonine-protein kinase